MRFTRNKIHILLVALMLVPSLVAPSLASSASIKPIKNADLGTSVASVQQIISAQPLWPFLVGRSKLEPNVCVGEDGKPFTKLTELKDSGTRDGNGISVSPSMYETENLSANSSYRTCLAVRSLSKDPVRIAIDDIDIKAAEGSSNDVSVRDKSKGVGTWVVPATRSFIAKKGVIYIVPYLINTPAKMPAGTIVGGIRAIRQALDEPIQASVAQRIYVSSPGGTRRPLIVSNINYSSRIIAKKPGKAALRISYTVRNKSDYLETYDSKLKVTGFGREVASTNRLGYSLLPSGVETVKLTQRGLPWIGLFRPTLTVESSSGKVVNNLPLVLVIPPLLYTLAVLAAIFIPFTYLFIRWNRNRKLVNYYLAQIAAEQAQAESDEYDEYEEL